MAATTLTRMWGGLVTLVVTFLVAAASLSAELPAGGPRDQIVDTTFGALSGRVTNVSYGAMPDVVVTLTGPALMTARTTTTRPDGHYLVPALPPGDYIVTFMRSGFRSVSIPVRVGASVTSTVDVVLQISTFTVAVAAAAPPEPALLDRHSTAVSEGFTKEQLAALPGSRSMFAVLSATPGVQVTRSEVGGNAADAAAPFSAYGTRGSNRPMVEGMSVTQISALGFTLDYGSFEQVATSLAAHGPEWPVPGVHVQFVAKSGGNQYRGSLYADLEHRDLQSHNIDTHEQQGPGESPSGLLSPDDNRLWRYYDVNADVGGYVVRDRAWWFGSLRDQDLQLRRVNFTVKPSRTHLRNYTQKTTARAGSHTFIGFVQTSGNHQPNRLDPFAPAGGAITSSNAIHNSKDATSDLRVSGAIWKAEWDGTFGERFFAEARGGQFEVRRRLVPNGVAPRFEDLDTLRVQGGGRHSEQRLRRTQVQASASYFRTGPDGSHHVKVGAEAIDTVSDAALQSAFPGNVLQVTRSGQPAEVYLFLTPSASVSGLLSAAMHVSDTWRATGRVALNLGLRFDRYRVYLPPQSPPPGAEGQPRVFAAVDNVVSWSQIAPRLGVVFDVFGNGKTLAKGSYGRYWLTPANLGPTSPNAAEWWRRYSWQDANSNGTWDPGEEGVLRDSRGGQAVQSIDPNLRAPWIDEATASVEREVPAAVALRSGIVWRLESRQYARQNSARPFNAFSDQVLIPDPGPDGRSGTPDDSTGIVGYNLHGDGSTPATLAANVVRNVNGPPSRHVTWEVAVHRRKRGRWSLAAGFAHTWSLENENEYGGQVVRQNEFVLTPNDLINTADRGRHRLRTWTATAWGTFDAPWSISITPLLRHQSGQPFGRTISALMNFGVIRVLAEPMGSRRMDNITLLDVRTERAVHGAGRRRVSVFLDVFNVFNANPVQDLNWASGAGFLQPLSVVSPRIARLGVRASF